ncbi:hypothetical protein EMIT043CA1_40352 [Pseudomonas brassicacearum]
MPVLSAEAVGQCSNASGVPSVWNSRWAPQKRSPFSPSAGALPHSSAASLLYLTSHPWRSHRYTAPGMASSALVPIEIKLSYSLGARVSLDSSSMFDISHPQTAWLKPFTGHQWSLDPYSSGEFRKTQCHKPRASKLEQYLGCLDH